MDTTFLWFYGDNRKVSAFVDGVRNSIEYTEKNIRTDLDAVQEMVETMF
jgi:hypothetical protein